MSHHIYKTDGFIMWSGNSGEASRFFQIFTKDLGMINARAQAVRLISSKLRFSLQDYSLCHLSLVRGKDAWRITSASKVADLRIRLGRERFLVFARVLSLLRRLLTGEEANLQLFKILLAAFSFLENQSLGDKLLPSFESILVLRILNSLGYIGKNPTLLPFLETELWHQDLLEQMAMVSREAIATINHSLNESQL